MMQQYRETQEEYPDSILFFRVGDFFEMFYEDAVEGARILNIALTSRDQNVPMAGVPHHSINAYINRLIEAGKSVVICDQIEDAKQAKGLVKRAVTRVVTPGTVLDPEILDEKANHYLASAYVQVKGNRAQKAGLAYVDLSTGDFSVTQLTGKEVETQLFNELARIRPVECLIPAEMGVESLLSPSGEVPVCAFLKPLEPSAYDLEAASELLRTRYGVQSLEGFGLTTGEEDSMDAAIRAAGACLYFLQETQGLRRDWGSSIDHLKTPSVYSTGEFMVLDAATRQNLELTHNLTDYTKHGTLLDILDETLTAMGGRKLRDWLLHPLVAVGPICQRLDAIQKFFEQPLQLDDLRSTLKSIADLERLLGRIATGTGGPRDLVALRNSLQRIPQLAANVVGLEAGLLDGISAFLTGVPPLADLIGQAVADDPPVSVGDGGVIREGYNPEVDRFRDLVRGGKNWIAALQKQESQRTGIPSLKIGYNKVFGYYIEVTNTHQKLVPDDYIRKQTLTNAERYVTPQLKEREEEILNAEEKMATLERDLFIQVCKEVCSYTSEVQSEADAVATLDVLASLAQAAIKRIYCRPRVNSGSSIVIRDGRHPVVEAIAPAGDFVPNDAEMDNDVAQILVITGPNMAGKSTYLRQVALITLMAQLGSFVPAREADIGIVDRIFTRVGASDRLTRGQSTFMVEMNETANILNSATNRSLVILDEIGRGTSTYDGVSIAWAVVEFLHERVGAKTLFATHYHELADLSKYYPRIRNCNVAVREWGGKIVFLYRIADGSTAHSYGIQVARLAGLPKSVIGRAHQVMAFLEETTERGEDALIRNPDGSPASIQLSIFSQPTGDEEFPDASSSPTGGILGAIAAELADLDLENMTPLEAMKRLAEWKEKLREEG